jgi:hypothetical protein
LISSTTLIGPACLRTWRQRDRRPDGRRREARETLDDRRVLRLVRGRLVDETTHRHPAVALVCDRALQIGAPARLDDLIQVAARRLQAMDDLRHRESLRETGVVVVRDAARHNASAVVSQCERRTLDAEALTSQQMREVGGNVPRFVRRRMAELFLDKAFDRGEEAGPALVEIAPRLRSGHRAANPFLGGATPMRRKVRPL